MRVFGLGRMGLDREGYWNLTEFSIRGLHTTLLSLLWRMTGWDVHLEFRAIWKICF